MAKPFGNVAEMTALQPGDVIRHLWRDSNNSYLVVLNMGDCLIVQRTLTAVNPAEWMPVIVNGKAVE